MQYYLFQYFMHFPHVFLRKGVRIDTNFMVLYYRNISVTHILICFREQEKHTKVFRANASFNKLFPVAVIKPTVN